MMRLLKMVRSSSRSGQSQAAYLSMLYPRIWKVLAALAVPFVMQCSNYFEAMERMGMLGAYIADLLLPVTIIGYIALIYMLKRHEI